MAVLMVLIETAARVSAQTALYSITDLGTLGGTSSSAYGINDAGLVVGVSSTSGNAFNHATLWTVNADGTVSSTDLGALGGSSSCAYGINSAGQIVGFSSASGINRATRWTVSAGGAVSTTDLGTLGGSFSCAYGINAAGQVVGVAETAVETEKFLPSHVQPRCALDGRFRHRSRRKQRIDQLRLRHQLSRSDSGRDRRRQ